MRVHANFYSQFDADYTRDVPAEGYVGWHVKPIDIDPARMALVVMHAWDCGTLEQYPGWWKACDEIPRTYRVVKEVFPRLLAGVRASGVPLIHVVGWGDYYKEKPGWKRTLALPVEKETPAGRATPDPTAQAIREAIRDLAFPGKHNLADIDRGSPTMTFARGAEPLDNEDIAANGAQLHAVCAARGVNHLVYVGFNIDWCLLMSPGGMLDMNRRGYVCSAIRQGVTAVENKETARRELCKEIGLWRVAINFGLVLDVDDFLSALASSKP